MPNLYYGSSWIIEPKKERIQCCCPSIRLSKWERDSKYPESEIEGNVVGCYICLPSSFVFFASYSISFPLEDLHVIILPSMITRTQDLPILCEESYSLGYHILVAYPYSLHYGIKILFLIYCIQALMTHIYYLWARPLANYPWMGLGLGWVRPWPISSYPNPQHLIRQLNLELSYKRSA